MAQAIVKKTMSKEYDLQALALNLALEVREPQVLVLINEEAKDKSSLLKNKLLRVFDEIKYNARISEENVVINRYKGQVDTKLLGARISMLNI